MGLRVAIAAIVAGLSLAGCGSSTPDNPGFAKVHLRTTPVAGDCEITGKGFRLVTKTPADVVVPLAAVPMEVTCVKIGYKGTSVLGSGDSPWSPGNIGTLLDSDLPLGRTLPETLQIPMTYMEAGTAADIAIMKTANETAAGPGGAAGTSPASPEASPSVKIDESALPSPQGATAPAARAEATAKPDAGPKPAPAPAATAPKPEADKTEPLTLAAVDDAFKVHLSSFRKKELAERSWRNLVKEYPQMLGPLKPIIDQVDVGAKGQFYRVYAGPLADAKAARDLCFFLRQKNVYCRPVSKGGK